MMHRIIGKVFFPLTMRHNTIIYKGQKIYRPKKKWQDMKTFTSHIQTQKS